MILTAWKLFLSWIIIHSNLICIAVVSRSLKVCTMLIKFSKIQIK